MQGIKVKKIEAEGREFKKKLLLYIGPFPQYLLLRETHLQM